MGIFFLLKVAKKAKNLPKTGLNNAGSDDIWAWTGWAQLVFSLNYFFFCMYTQIEDDGGSTLGKIVKKWRGCFSETLTDTDTFKIEFPDNIDVTTKALLMGATMLVVRSFQ